MGSCCCFDPCVCPGVHRQGRGSADSTGHRGWLAECGAGVPDTGQWITVEVSADASAEVVTNEDATDEGVEEAADEGDICDICCTIMPPRSEVLECPSCVLWVCRPCQARLSKLLDGSPQIQCLRGCGTLVTATTDGDCSSDG
mmetsp:Transcript_61643/g.201165  ORF Transcript_61643/g.201165 Transcript_61643/m.201165 type:complete len:143 (-) Transcript_61643:258-686(-)